MQVHLAKIATCEAPALRLGSWESNQEAKVLERSPYVKKKTPYVQAYTLTTKIFKTHICHNILKAVNADWQHFQDPLSPHALEARKACGDLNFQPLNMWHFCGNKQIKSWFPNIAFVRLGLLILVFHYRTRYSIISVSHAFFKQCSHASGERGRLWR